MSLWVIEYRFKGQGSGVWQINRELVFLDRARAETEMEVRNKAYSYNTEYRIAEYRRVEEVEN